MKKIPGFLFILISISVSAQNINPNPWLMAVDSTAEISYNNPVIPGFYPDPSVCRVGSDYYLVNSSFEYFPAVPIFHSKDLINWKQIGHCIHDKDQIKGEINIFAPTIRYNDGIFYMITTNITFGGNFIVTAKNPAGPWSEAIWIDMPEIDPDLFFDDDGNVYVISSTFELAMINPLTGQLLSERKKVWNSSGGRYPEAPHIYKKDGFYYLMAAEGGTEEAHMVTIARSNNIWGPYIDNPANPIATHVGVSGMGNPIQGIGHGDLIQAHDNSWWMLLHGYRSVTGYPPHHILGRETCLVPVSWPKGGWPVVNGNGTVLTEMTCPTLPQFPVEQKAVRTLFNSQSLDMEWNYIQPAVNGNIEIDKDKEVLVLKGSALKIGESGNPTFVGRRLTDINFSVTTRMDFNPNIENEEAGLILLNNGSHFDLMVQNINGKRMLYVKLQFGQTIYQSSGIELKPGYVDLRIEGNGPEFIFSYSQNSSEFQIIEKADSRFLSTQTLGWFTGVYAGMYASGNGSLSETTALYHWFDYVGM